MIIDEKRKNTPSPIIVKFNSMCKRISVFANKKRLAGKNFAEIGIDATKVYINENLTPTTRSMFYHANILKKKHGWKYIWTFNGNIKMRKEDNYPTLFIKDNSDLDKITTQPSTII